MARLHGAIAATVTPLREGGASVDADAIAGLCAFLAAGGVDGVLTCGTTGEGVLLTVAERRTVTERFLAARGEGFLVAVQAGAQTTAETVALAVHARDVSADAVAVIAPPYFPLDTEELTRHLVRAAAACDPLPFYVYAFAGRSGYPIPVEVALRVRDEAPNTAGMKVSDTPFSAVEPYLGLGLDVFVGSEPLVLEGMEAGAVGCVSGLAAAFPEVVSTLVHDRDARAQETVTRLREQLVGVPFHAALKEVLVAKGVLGSADVRAPLRGLSTEESRQVREGAGTREH